MKQSQFLRCPKCQKVYKVEFDPDIEGKIGFCPVCGIEFVNCLKVTKKRRFYDFVNSVEKPRLLCSCTFEPDVRTLLTGHYFELLVAIATINGLCFRWQCVNCKNSFELIMENFKPL